jgi:type I restriction enzyme S subunit
MKATIETISSSINSGISRAFYDEPKGIPVLRSNNVQNGEVRTEGLKYWYEKDPQGAKYTEVIPKDGDILVNFVNGSQTELGKAGVYRGIPKRCLVSTNFFIVRLNKDLVHVDYMKYIFQSNLYKKWLYQAAGFTGQGSFNKTDFGKFSFNLPSLEEQTYIIRLFSTWDTAIETLEKLIAAKRMRRQYYVQNEIFKKCKKWKHSKVSEIFDEISIRKQSSYELLSVTQDRGVLPRRMLEGRVMSPEGSLDGYKLVEKGDFVISLRSFQGGLEYSDYTGLISPAYTILRQKISMDKNFFRVFFKSSIFIDKYLAISVIGIRDGKQVSVPDFMSCKLPTPPLEEQNRIAILISGFDNEILLLESLLDNYQQQKRGLMQKLLTGEWRIRPEIVKRYEEE